MRAGERIVAAVDSEVVQIRASVLVEARIVAVTTAQVEERIEVVLRVYVRTRVSKRGRT
jgi:hypothetical protein